MDKNTHLPLKVVPALERDYYQPDGGGGPKKVFGEVNVETRATLRSQVDSVSSYFIGSFAEYPDVPAVARVKIKQEAIAKSHRPSALFTQSTCPIIGSESLGQLLVSVTPSGLKKLTNKIDTGRTKQVIANLSTIISIEPYKPTIGSLEGSAIKVKLFQHHDELHDQKIDESFRNILNDLNVFESNEIQYGSGLKIYRIPTSNRELVEKLKTYIGTQSVGSFPIYQPVRTSAIKIRAIADQDFPAPDQALEYPTIGIIDSGTSEKDRYLSPWRIARERYIPDC